VADEAEQTAKRTEEQAQARQMSFDRRYRLLELRERRADRDLKLRELELNAGRGIRFTSGQATVVGALIALLSAVIGGSIQGLVTQDVEAGKNQALLRVEQLKAESNIALENKKQDAAERLDRAKFETTLILKATEAVKRDDQVRNLKFFLNAGFIRDPDQKIAKMNEGDYPSSPPPGTLTPADIYRELGKGVGLVKVWPAEGGEWQGGTCFIISNSGYAITTSRLVGDGLNRKITVSMGSKEATPREAVVVKTGKDLALIKLTDNVDYVPLRSAKDQLSLGESVIILGYPSGQSMTLVFGYVYSLSDVSLGYPNGIGINAGVAAGHGGAPVLNKNGDVVGVIAGYYTDQSGRVLAIPMASLQELVSMSK
jgi:S1-C subfamily serine protease